MHPDADEARGPPPAPEIDRRLRLSRGQGVAIPAMMLIPALAVAGVLGDHRRRDAVVAGGLALEVDFAATEHADREGALRLTVESRSGAPRAAVVELDRGLLDAFTALRIHPAIDRIDGDAYVVPLGELAPGASRVITVDYSAGRWGRLRGALRVRAAEGVIAELPIEMWVFP